MKKTNKNFTQVIAVCALLWAFTSCENTTQGKPHTAPDTISHTDDDKVEGGLYTSAPEKHFDCLVEEILREDQTKEGVCGKYSVVTECGVFFYTDTHYRIGDTLQNFISGKHN